MTAGRRRAAAVLTVLGLLYLRPRPAAGAERPWIETRSPHFVVVSNSGEKEARRIAWQFEQVRSVFRTLWPWGRTDPGRRFVVLAVRDAASLRRLAPQYWEQRGGVRPAGVFVSDAGHDYVALQTDVLEPTEADVNPYGIAYEGYAHMVLNATFPGRLPLWYQRGFAELVGNTVVRAKDVHVGRLIPWHMRTLNERSRLRLRELLAVDRQSPHYTDASRREVFDAQSWLFVHYLAFSANRAHLPRLNRFAVLLAQGREPGQAFAEALGPLEPLEDGLTDYVTRRLYQYMVVKADLNVEREAFPVRPLPPAEAAAVRAGFHAAMQRPGEARALLAEARQAAPDLPVVSEVEGVLLDAENKREEARAAFARAAELGSRSFYVHHRLAQLLWRPQPDRETLARVAAALKTAVELNPESADAYSFLADTKTQLDQAEEALGLARRAVSLEPGEPRHRLAVARALARAQQHDAARQEAERALAQATETDDRQAAQQLLDWLRQFIPRPQ
jgi:tetratricopeptide (TPR) repeat protein